MRLVRSDRNHAEHFSGASASGMANLFWCQILPFRFRRACSPSLPTVPGTQGEQAHKRIGKVDAFLDVDKRKSPCRRYGQGDLCFHGERRKGHGSAKDCAIKDVLPGVSPPAAGGDPP